MKILYGVQATGNGHISRSREVIQHLKDLGHEVRVILTGRDPALLWEMETFEPYDTFRGLTFISRRGKVRIIRTTLQLNLFQFYRDIASYDASGFDLVVTDFEPVAARIARRNKIPSIGVGHQYAFLHDIPVK
ncbi:MAG: glycosyltransferase family protein, partial [Desulfobacterales bacterium]